MDSLKDFKMGMDLTAKTFAGLEDELASELKSLGAIDVDIIKRRRDRYTHMILNDQCVFN